MSQRDLEKQDELLRNYEYSFNVSESLTGSFRDATSDIILLLLFGAVFFMGAFASFIKYDVR